MNTIIEKYQVRLIPLEESYIEYVRNLRNLPQNSSQLIYNKYITQEQQLIWYQSLDKSLNKYFIVEYQGVKTGVVNIKDIDYLKSEGEVGFFMDPQYTGQHIAFRAVIALHHFCFDILNLQSVRIEVFKTNTVSLNFSQKLGYEIQDRSDKQLSFLILSKSRFDAIKQNLEKVLDKKQNNKRK